MIQFLIKNKSMLGGAALLVIGVFVYFTYFSGGAAPEITETGGESPLSQEILTALNNLNNIKLDSAIFKDPVFISLTDYGVTIPQEPVGRRNPFESITVPGQGLQIPRSQ